MVANFKSYLRCRGVSWLSSALERKSFVRWLQHALQYDFGAILSRDFEPGALGLRYQMPLTLAALSVELSSVGMFKSAA